MTNTSTAPVQVELYDIYVKRDLPASYVYSIPGTSEVFPLYPDPARYWQVGAANSSGTPAGNLGGPADPSLHYGASPFDSQLFKEYFGVSKRTIVMLPQGAVHRHVSLQKPSYLVTDAMSVSNVAAVTGLAHFTMYVIKGFPSSGKDSADPPISHTSTTIPQVSFVQSRRYKYTWCSDATQTLQNENKLYGNSGWEPENINIGSGEVDISTGRTEY